MLLDENQEMVSDKKSVNNRDMVSDVKIDITPEISNTFHKEEQAFENKTVESAGHNNKNSKPAVLVIKKNNTKEEVVMSKPCLMLQYVPVVLKTWCLIQEATMVVLNMIRYLKPKSLNLKAEVPNMVLLMKSMC